MPPKTTQDTQGARPILAIDTSSAQGGVALYNGAILSTRSWPAERSHTTTLLAEIHHLLAAAKSEISELAAVAVAIGPGAFTGLRVGLGVAKGFHLATGMPLIGVSTLQATALPFACCGRTVVSTVAAGRGRLVWAYYQADGDNLVETRPPRNGTLDDFAADIGSAGQIIICGELDEAQDDYLSALEHVVVPSLPVRIRKPGALAEIGWRRWRAGEVDDAAALEPIYLSR